MLTAMLAALVLTTAPDDGRSRLKLALEADFSQYVHVDRGTVEAWYRIACKTGSKLACKYKSSHRKTPAFGPLVKAMTPALQALDPLGGVALGWALSQRTPDGRPHKDGADLTRAAKLFQQACEAGEPRGCSELGRLYSYGVGVAQDFQKARQLFDRACKAKGGQGCSAQGFELKYRQSKAAQGCALFETGCKLGYATGCYNAGNCRVDKSLGPPDYIRSHALFETACQGGEQDGCASVARQVLLGQGAKKNEKLGLLLSRAACAKGGLHGCYVAGRALLMGLGVEQDPVAGIRLVRKACDGGDQGGCLELGISYRDGRGVQPDLKLARKLIETACKSGFPAACKQPVTPREIR